MRILHMLQRLSLAASVVVLGGGGLSGALDRTLPSTAIEFDDDATESSDRDLFNRAIYDIRGLFVGNVVDVVYFPGEFEASLLIVGVGSLPGTAFKDIALNPKAMRGVVREQRRVLVSDKNREALLASAAVRFDAASATWIPDDPPLEINP
jgi:sporulation protein YlmC with PRC-barrel domain